MSKEKRPAWETWRYTGLSRTEAAALVKSGRG